MLPVSYLVEMVNFVLSPVLLNKLLLNYTEEQWTQIHALPRNYWSLLNNKVREFLFLNIKKEFLSTLKMVATFIFIALIF